MKNLDAVGMLVGTIIGAGIFALPYSISKAGIIWGAIHFIITFFVVLTLHIIYARIVYNLPKNRFVGYTKILLGKKVGKISLFNTLFSYYGSLLVYAILGGIFINNIFPFLSSFYWSFVFLAAGISFIFFNIYNIGKVNFYLTIPLIILLIGLSVLFLARIELNNFYKLNNFFSSAWFLPYGVFIFSFSGFAALPNVLDFLKNKSKSYSFSQFKKIIIISQALVAFVYIIFIISILGLFGTNLQENIFLDAHRFLGLKGIYFMSLAGFLAVFTSFIAMSQDFKYIYLVDLKFSLTRSLFFIAAPITVFLFLANQKFVEITSFIGGLSFGLFGLFILLMNRKFEKQGGKTEIFDNKIIIFIIIVLLSVFVILNILQAFLKFFS